MQKLTRMLVPALGLVVVAGGLSGCVSAPEPDPGQLRIVRIWTAYRTADSFARFGTFREQDEEPGNAIILRTQPEAREGYYFTIRLQAGRDQPIPANGTLVVEVVAPNAAEPRRFEFPFSTDDARSAQLLAGLTGADWPYAPEEPLAWRIEVVDATGRPVAEQESYLWAHP